jgi:hypothetical protein
MRPTIGIIVELPQMHNLVDRSGIGLEVSDQFLVMTALLERRKANLLIELHRLGYCARSERIGSRFIEGGSQTAALAEKVTAFRHPKLSAVRLAGELNKKPTDGASLDELLERSKAELTKLGPILDLEVVSEPEGSRTEGGLTLANESIEHGWRSGA